MTASRHQSELLDLIDRNPAALLTFFDLPISFHRSYIPITGRVTAALLLSVAVQITHDMQDLGTGDGWIARTNDEWAAETGLSRDELLTARRCLRELGLLLERRDRDARGLRIQMKYRVDFERLSQLLAQEAQRGEAPAPLVEV